MKKILAFLTLTVIIFNLTACGNPDVTPDISGDISSESGEDADAAIRKVLESRTREIIKYIEDNNYNSFSSCFSKDSIENDAKQTYTKEYLDGKSPKKSGAEKSSYISRGSDNYSCKMTYNYYEQDNKENVYQIIYNFYYKYENSKYMLDVSNGLSIEKTAASININESEYQERRVNVPAPCGDMRAVITKGTNKSKKQPLVIMVGEFLGTPIFYENSDYDSALFKNISLKFAQNNITAIRFSSPKDYYKSLDNDTLTKSYEELILNNVKAVVNYALKMDNYDKDKVYILSDNTGFIPALDIAKDDPRIKSAILLSPRMQELTEIIGHEFINPDDSNKAEVINEMDSINNSEMENDKKYLGYGKKFWEQINIRDNNSRFLQYFCKNTKIPLYFIESENYHKISSSSELDDVKYKEKLFDSVTFKLIENADKNFYNTDDIKTFSNSFIDYMVNDIINK